MGLFRKILNIFSDAVFVNFSCIFCNTETVNESLICPQCEKKLKTLNGNVCKKCGAQVNLMDKSCYACFEKEYKFKTHKSCFVYDELSSTPVKFLKYEKKKYLAEPMARVMYAFHKDLFNDIDIITFVPMTYERFKNRGYNHSYELAKHLSKISKIKLEKLLIKNTNTEHQAGLNFDERIKNLKGSFVCEENIKDSIKGKRILIIDDVFTTGSTIHECARILYDKNVKSVSAITFLKTDPYQNINDLPF